MAKEKRRRSIFPTLILIVFLLLLIIGIFFLWSNYLNGEDDLGSLSATEGDNEDVSVNVGEAEASSVVIEIDNENSDLALSFDYQDPVIENPIVSGEGEEDLTFSLAYTVTGANKTLNEGDIELSLSIPSEVIEFYKNTLVWIEDEITYSYLDTSCISSSPWTLVGNNYVYSFTLSEATIDTYQTEDAFTYLTTEYCYNDDYSVAYVTTTFNFRWGDRFNYVNPSNSTDVNVYNWLTDFRSKMYGSADGDTLVDEAKISITITPEVI